MKLIKNSKESFVSKKKNLGIFILGLMIGFLLCIIFYIIPTQFNNIEIKKEIDLSSIISIISLFVTIVITIFIMPFIIEKTRNNRLNIQSIAVDDLDTLCERVDDIRAIYRDHLSKKRMQEKEYSIVLSSFKQISNLSGALAEEFKMRKIGHDFDKEVISQREKAYKKSTFWLTKNQEIDKNNLQDAIVSLDNLYNALKQFRYKIYDN